MLSGSESGIPLDVPTALNRNSPEYKAYLLRKKHLLELEKKKKAELPHLFGFKHYWWSRIYFESMKRLNYLTAANQMGKSSVQIRKCVHWATESSMWSKLWPNREPSMFFYIYPSKPLATREYHSKWVKEFLPRGSMKDDSQYGWKPEFKNGEIYAIHFFSGISLYFLTYAMDVDDLQASTPDAIFCDEEPPVKIIPELLMRLEASKGYWHLCCTPTKGQQYFRDIFEGKTQLPDALVLVVSLYDATKYDDGTAGQYTLAEVKRRESLLANEKEIQLRIFGRFVRAEGLVYSGFDIDRNFKVMGTPIPNDWIIAGAVDVGSGGDEGHPAAIAFVAVKMGPKGATQGRVFKMWRGDGIETTNPDILQKYVELKGSMNMTWENYDHASADFKIHAQRAGINFVGADKGSKGIGLLNSLFKTGMLTIDADHPEASKLLNELENFRVDQNKRKAKDDLIDAVRYCVTRINWDFSNIVGPSKEVIEKIKQEKKPMVREREGILEEVIDVDDSYIDELNDLMGV